MSKEELKKLKEKVEDLQEELEELTDEELDQIVGGAKVVTTVVTVLREPLTIDDAAVANAQGVTVPGRRDTMAD